MSWSTVILLKTTKSNSTYQKSSYSGVSAHFHWSTSAFQHKTSCNCSRGSALDAAATVTDTVAQITCSRTCFYIIAFTLYIYRMRQPVKSGRNHKTKYIFLPIFDTYPFRLEFINCVTFSVHSRMVVVQICKLSSMNYQLHNAETTIEETK